MRKEVCSSSNPLNPTAEAFQRESSLKRNQILTLAVLTMLLAAITINAGAADTHPVQVLRAVLGLESGTSNAVIWNIRMPRVIGGMMAGVGLAVAGCVMQTCLRNSLASPFTLGISSASTFLLENKPPLMHLVVATREDPFLPIASAGGVLYGPLDHLQCQCLRQLVLHAWGVWRRHSHVVQQASVYRMKPNGLDDPRQTPNRTRDKTSPATSYQRGL